MQDLLVPLEIKDLAAALIALHNPSLVNLSHVQVEGASVAERHRVTSGTFERPYINLFSNLNFMSTNAN